MIIVNIIFFILTIGAFVFFVKRTNRVFNLFMEQLRTQVNLQNEERDRILDEEMKRIENRAKMHLKRNKQYTRNKLTNFKQIRKSLEGVGANAKNKT